MQQNPDIRARYAREHIPNAVFYIPFTYYYVVRLGTFPKLLSWLLIYIMPTAFYSAFTYSGTPWPFIGNYLLTLIAAFSLYELGYIANDTVAIRYEEQPAIRLYPHNFAHVDKYRIWIYLLRICYAVAAMLFIPSLACQIAILAILPIFALYNRWRSHYNVLLYPFLVFSRYLPFMLIYDFDWLATLMLFLSFPLLNWLERFSMPRHRFPFMRILIPTEDSKTAFRVWYYALILALCVVGFLLFSFDFQRSGLSTFSAAVFIPIILLFLYRLALLVILRYHHPKNYLNG